MDAPPSLMDRARDLGQEAWRHLRADPVTLALPLVLLGLVTGGDGGRPDRQWRWPPDADPLVYLPFFAILGLFAVVLLVLLFFAYSWAWLTTTRAALDRIDGRPSDLAGALRATRGQVVPAAGTFLLWLLVVLAGFLLLVVPGVVALAGLAPVVAVVLAEGRSGPGALGRAWELTKGHKGEVALLILFGFLVDVAAAILLSWLPIVGSALAGIVGGVVASWGAVVAAVLYRRKAPAPAA